MVCLRQLESFLFTSSCSQQQVKVPQSRPSQNQLNVEASEGALANNASKRATITRPDKSFLIYFFTSISVIQRESFSRIAASSSFISMAPLQCFRICPSLTSMTEGTAFTPHCFQVSPLSSRIG